MRTIELRVNSIKDITNLVQIASASSGIINVKSGNHSVNAKSLLGICSLDLSKKIIVEYSENVSEKTIKLLENIKLRRMINEI